MCARVAKSQTRAASSDKPAERQSRATTAPREAEASETGTQKVYIGKGRFIDDDPEKYPDKNKLGVGGWAGGEAGARLLGFLRALHVATLCGMHGERLCALPARMTGVRASWMPCQRQGSSRVFVSAAKVPVEPSGRGTHTRLAIATAHQHTRNVSGSHFARSCVRGHVQF